MRRGGNRKPRESGLAGGPKFKPSLGFAPISLGPSGPHFGPQRSPNVHLLGTPLSIREAARIIGCSPWTVRQRLVPMGLPCFRSGASGKMIFYHDQVVRWIESQEGANM